MMTLLKCFVYPQIWQFCCIFSPVCLLLKASGKQCWELFWFCLPFFLEYMCVLVDMNLLFCFSVTHSHWHFYWEHKSHSEKRERESFWNCETTESYHFAGKYCAYESLWHKWYERDENDWQKDPKLIFDTLCFEEISMVFSFCFGSIFLLCIQIVIVMRISRSL